MTKIKTLVWGEIRHEKKNPTVAAIYPDGMHETIAGFLRQDKNFSVSTTWLDQPEHGLTTEVLASTDVLIWWGHMAHGEVSDEVVARVRKRVLEGMGLIVLHSGHYAKIFKVLMGTTCSLKWRESTDKERIWNIAPHHPITTGIGEYFEIPAEEMYGEPFGIPSPGSFGDFHIKPTQKEMVYIGGGAGMAPLRAHLSHLFETENTARKVSYWYGARSAQEFYYTGFFETLAARHPNFSFHTALSSPLPEDGWTGLTGFIHEVVLDRYLSVHPDPKAVEYYLCGPPLMIKACTRVLKELGVPERQIAYDEF